MVNLRSLLNWIDKLSVKASPLAGKAAEYTDLRTGKLYRALNSKFVKAGIIGLTGVSTAWGVGKALDREMTETEIYRRGRVRVNPRPYTYEIEQNRYSNQRDIRFGSPISMGIAGAVSYTVYSELQKKRIGALLVKKLGSISIEDGRTFSSLRQFSKLKKLSVKGVPILGAVLAAPVAYQVASAIITSFKQKSTEIKNVGMLATNKVIIDDDIPKGAPAVAPVPQDLTTTVNTYISVNNFKDDYSSRTKRNTI
jgi:hypothetical protein